MRTICCVGLMVALGSAVEGTARAQEEIRAFAGPVVLLRNRDVQEELQITRPQKLRLHEDLERVRDRYKEEIGRVHSMKPQERERFRTTIQAELHEATRQILS